MTLNKYSTAAAAAACIFVGITATWVWSNYKIGKLERVVESAKADANEKAAAANALEKQAAIYAAKTEYLEQKLAEIQAIARKQDEELEKLNISTNAARGRMERARRVRTVAATADELCGKLEEIGHPCAEQ